MLIKLWKWFFDPCPHVWKIIRTDERWPSWWIGKYPESIRYILQCDKCSKIKTVWEG